MPSQVQRSLFHEEETAGGQRWLMTFNDMITLLMVFFVLLFTMSSLDAKRFKTFQNGLQSAMGVLYEGRHAPIGTISNELSSTGQQSEDINDHADAHKGQLAALTETRGLEAEYTAKGIQADIGR